MERPSIDIDLNMSDATSKRALMAALSPLQGLYDVDIHPVRITRSNRANRYVWGVVVKLYAQYLTECEGETVDKEEAFIGLKRRFAKRIIINKKTGKVVDVTTKRTSKMSKAAFGEFIENCIKYMEEDCGISVPPPEIYGVNVKADSQPHRRLTGHTAQPVAGASLKKPIRQLEHHHA